MAQHSNIIQVLYSAKTTYCHLFEVRMYLFEMRFFVFVCLFTLKTIHTTTYNNTGLAEQQQHINCYKLMQVFTHTLDKHQIIIDKSLATHLGPTEVYYIVDCFICCSLCLFIYHLSY